MSSQQKFQSPCKAKSDSTRRSVRGRYYVGRPPYVAYMRALSCACALFAVAPAAGSGHAAGKQLPIYDVVIRNGLVFDGSGNIPSAADVAITGDRIALIAPHISAIGRTEIDAHGRAVAPGFINMLSHSEESLLLDRRALSDLVQGVTLEVLGEESMGPLSPAMKSAMLKRQGDIRYPIQWTTLGQYLETLERMGIAPNVASFVGAGTVRNAVLGYDNVQPTDSQLDAMRSLVRQGMEQGALGVTTALGYTPNVFAKTPELVALAKVSAQCGGIYSAHIRNQGDWLENGLQETFDVAEASGAPAEVYHFKQAGRDNWDKLDKEIAMVNAERRKGVRITADMYLYNASQSGLESAMPPWVQDGGYDQWVTRLHDPVIRAKVKAAMDDPHPRDWENLYARTGPDKILLLGFKNPKLKPLSGKSLAEVARMRRMSPEETAMDLVIEDGTSVSTAYFEMSEANLRREVRIPWMSFGSDAPAPAPEGAFLRSLDHPRTYGNFARLLGHYVRENSDLTLTEAIRRLTSFPADTLSLRDRGRLQKGYFADVVVFDPKTISDHSTYDHPAQLATGVDDVFVNGQLALRDGKPTGSPTGRVVRGRAWTGVPGGGCRTGPTDWHWKM